MRIDARVDSAAVAVAVAGLALAVLLPITAHCQRAAGSEGERTRETPTIRSGVYDGLGEAQTCLNEDDFECAREVLDDLRGMRGLSGFEAAQIWTAYGSLHVAEERYQDAIDAFEVATDQEGITLAVEQNALYSLAQLYGQEEMYEEALGALGRWFDLSEAPSPEAWMLKARFHYLLEEYREAVEPAETAIRLAGERGREPEEIWFQVLQYCYIELEDVANAIRVGAAAVERWPNEQNVVMLAALHGRQGDEVAQLGLYEAAYEAGWLTSGSELERFARLLLGAEIPYKAARLLEQGLEDGVIESTSDNWAVLAEAWRMAREQERALSALSRASQHDDDGEIDVRLARTYSDLARWTECVDAIDTALERGVRRPAEARIQRGICLVSLERWDEARAALRRAGEDERVRASAESWLGYLESAERSASELDRMREETRRLRGELDAAMPEED